MTILGAHTAHELSDLLAAKNSNIASLGNALAGVTGQVDLTDPTWSQWVTDWHAFLANWANVNATASEAVTTDKASLLGWDYTTEETQYQAVLAAMPPFDDLVRRWATLPNNPDPSEAGAAPTPQPNAPDSDLNFVNATAPIANAVDATVSTIKSAASAIANPFGSPTLLFAGGALLLVTVLVVASRR